MGPRVFARGDERHVGDSPARDQGFNGATRVRAWRFAIRSSEVSGIKKLQWGHACSRVEIRMVLVSEVVRLQASMGPRVFARGDSM